jgi:hypothetical protein
MPAFAFETRDTHTVFILLQALQWEMRGGRWSRATTREQRLSLRRNGDEIRPGSGAHTLPLGFPRGALCDVTRHYRPFGFQWGVAVVPSSSTR